MVNQHCLHTMGSPGKASLATEVIPTSRKPILRQTMRARNVAPRECKTKNTRPRNPKWRVTN